MIAMEKSQKSYIKQQRSPSKLVALHSCFIWEYKKQTKTEPTLKSMNYIVTCEMYRSSRAFPRPKHYQKHHSLRSHIGEKDTRDVGAISFAIFKIPYCIAINIHRNNLKNQPTFALIFQKANKHHSRFTNSIANIKAPFGTKEKCMNFSGFGSYR
jgi:hypothetical protein